MAKLSIVKPGGGTGSGGSNGEPGGAGITYKSWDARPTMAPIEYPLIRTEFIPDSFTEDFQGEAVITGSSVVFDSSSRHVPLIIVDFDTTFKSGGAYKATYDNDGGTLQFVMFGFSSAPLNPTKIQFQIQNQEYKDKEFLIYFEGMLHGEEPDIRLIINKVRVTGIINGTTYNNLEFALANEVVINKGEELVISIDNFRSKMSLTRLYNNERIDFTFPQSWLKEMYNTELRPFRSVYANSSPIQVTTSFDIPNEIVPLDSAKIYHQAPYAQAPLPNGLAVDDFIKIQGPGIYGSETFNDEDLLQVVSINPVKFRNLTSSNKFATTIWRTVQPSDAVYGKIYGEWDYSKQELLTNTGNTTNNIIEVDSSELLSGLNVAYLETDLNYNGGLVEFEILPTSSNLETSNETDKLSFVMADKSATKDEIYNFVKNGTPSKNLVIEVVARLSASLERMYVNLNISKNLEILSGEHTIPKEVYVNSLVDYDEHVQFSQDHPELILENESEVMFATFFLHTLDHYRIFINFNDSKRTITVGMRNVTPLNEEAMSYEEFTIPDVFNTKFPEEYFGGFVEISGTGLYVDEEFTFDNRNGDFSGFCAVTNTKSISTISGFNSYVYVDATFDIVTELVANNTISPSELEPTEGNGYLNNATISGQVITPVNPSAQTMKAVFGGKMNMVGLDGVTTNYPFDDQAAFVINLELSGNFYNNTYTVGLNRNSCGSYVITQEDHNTDVQGLYITIAFSGQYSHPIVSISDNIDGSTNTSSGNSLFNMLTITTSPLNISVCISRNETIVRMKQSWNEGSVTINSGWNSFHYSGGTFHDIADISFSPCILQYSGSYSLVPVTVDINRRNFDSYNYSMQSYYYDMISLGSNILDSGDITLETTDIREKLLALYPDTSGIPPVGTFINFRATSPAVYIDFNLSNIGCYTFNDSVQSLGTPRYLLNQGSLAFFYNNLGDYKIVFSSDVETDDFLATTGSYTENVGVNSFSADLLPFLNTYELGTVNNIKPSRKIKLAFAESISDSVEDPMLFKRFDLKTYFNTPLTMLQSYIGDEILKSSTGFIKDVVMLSPSVRLSPMPNVVPGSLLLAKGESVSYETEHVNNNDVIVVNEFGLPTNLTTPVKVLKVGKTRIRQITAKLSNSSDDKTTDTAINFVDNTASYLYHTT